MKKGKTQKVLVYPKFKKNSYNYMYTNVLLFYPLRSDIDMLIGDVRQMFMETDDDLSDQTIVERIKRLVRLFNKFS